MNQKGDQQPGEKQSHQDDLVFFFQAEGGALGKVDQEESSQNGKQFDKEKNHAKRDKSARFPFAQKYKMKCQVNALQNEINPDGNENNESGEIDPTHQIEQQRQK